MSLLAVFLIPCHLIYASSLSEDSLFDAASYLPLHDRLLKHIHLPFPPTTTITLGEATSMRFLTDRKIRKSIQSVPVIQLTHADDLFSLSNYNITDQDLIDIQPYLNQLTHLTALSLSCNQIKTIPSDLLESLTSLDQLNLSHNIIESIPVNLFINNMVLYKVDLGENLITEINDQTFKHLGNLEYLFLAYNQPQSITLTCLDLKPRLRSVTFYGNKNIPHQWQVDIRKRIPQIT